MLNQKVAITRLTNSWLFSLYELISKGLFHIFSNEFRFRPDSSYGIEVIHKCRCAVQSMIQHAFYTYYKLLFEQESIMNYKDHDENK